MSKSNPSLCKHQNRSPYFSEFKIDPFFFQILEFISISNLENDLFICYILMSTPHSSIFHSRSLHFTEVKFDPCFNFQKQPPNFGNIKVKFLSFEASKSPFSFLILQNGYFIFYMSKSIPLIFKFLKSTQKFCTKNMKKKRNLFFTI